MLRQHYLLRIPTLLFMVFVSMGSAAAQSAPDFSITIEPALVVVSPGNEGVFTIHISSLGGFDAPVALDLIAVAPQVGNRSWTFDPGQVTPAPGAPATSRFAIRVRGEVEATYVLTLEGRGGGLSRTATTTVRYERLKDAFKLTPSAESVVLQAGPAPGAVDVLLTMEPTGGYQSHVDLTLIQTGGFDVSFEKTRLSPWETARVTVMKRPGFAVRTGRYNVLIRGTGGAGAAFDVDIGVHFVPNFAYATGDQRVLFVPLRMKNAPQRSRLEDIQPDIDRAVAYFREVSYGKLRLQADVRSTWYELPGSHEDYFVVGTRLITEDCLNAIDGDVDLRDYSFFVFLLEGTDAAFASSFRSAATNDGEVQFAVAHVPAQSPGLIVHEMGHMFYLPDLYDRNRKEFFFTYWDEMGEGAAHFSGWSRQKLGWLPEEQIAEAKPGETRTFTLSPIELPGPETKLIRIPNVVLPEAKRPAGPPFLPAFSSPKYFYAEARKRVGYDSGIPSDGLLLYSVDETIPSGSGPLRLIDATPATPTLADAAFSPMPGDRSVFEDAAAGLRVSVEHRDGDQYVVETAYFPVGRTTLNVELGSHAAATAATAAGAGSTQAGYLEASVTAGAAPYAVAVISFEQNGVVVSEVGVPVSRPTNLARVFVDFRTDTTVPGSAGTVDIFTGFAAVNRGVGNATLALTLRDLNGTVLASGSGVLGKGAHIAKFVEQLGEMFTGFSVPPSFPVSTAFGTLEISSDEPVSVVALRLTVNQRGEALLTTTPVADLSQSPSTSPLAFPQFADGGGYSTSVFLTNTSPHPQSGSLRWLGDGGEPLEVTLTDGAKGSSFRYSIPADGARVFRTNSGGSIARSGWIHLSPDPGNSAPSGVGLFEYSQNGILVTQTGIPATFQTTRARIYAGVFGGRDTGLALANPGIAAIELTLSAFDRHGMPVTGAAPLRLALAGSGHSSKFVRQYIPALPDNFQGVIEISSTSPFAALTVRSLVNSRGDFLLTSFPVADLEAAPPSPILFPQIADRGGYRTEVIFLSPGTPASMRLTFFDDAGGALPVGQ